MNNSNSDYGLWITCSTLAYTSKKTIYYNRFCTFTSEDVGTIQVSGLSIIHSLANSLFNDISYFITNSFK